MTQSDPAARAAALPCWSGPVEPEPLEGGITNLNFTVRDRPGPAGQGGGPGGGVALRHLSWCSLTFDASVPIQGPALDLRSWTDKRSEASHGMING